MYKTKYEMLDQYNALEKTYEYMKSITEAIRDFKRKNVFSSITFIGSGSSYCLCKSAEISMKLRTELKVNSIAAGDLMLNFEHYRKLISNTLIIVPSRSGQTTEVIEAIKMAKEEQGVYCISICMQKGSELSKVSDLSIELPWAYDESVCQTRTVTNLYAANLYLIGALSDDNLLCEEIAQAIDFGGKHLLQYTEILSRVVKDYSWEYVVSLADSEVEGIADAGALAFKEICQLPSNYHHILDVRHGPAVLIREKTLVIMLATPYKVQLQVDLIHQLNKKGAITVIIDSNKENIYDSDCHVYIPHYKNYSVTGIPYIFVPQVLSYLKAIETGVNPDVPQGLDSWIRL